MTTVSIIITCYNLGAYLEEALESALAQNYADFEVLLIDDGSTDPATIDLVDRLPPNPRLHVLRIANQGVCRARNYGISMAKGTYILPLDADDRIHPEYLNHAVPVLETNPSVGFVGCHYRLFEDYQSLYTPNQYQLPDLLVENVVPITSLFRRVAWEQVGGYFPDIAIEDWDFWLSLIEHGYSGIVIPEVLFEHRMRTDSRHGHNQQPDVYQQTLVLLYDRHRPLYDRFIYEVLSRKDLEYAKTLAHGIWLEQQWHRWQAVAEERQEIMKSLGVRPRLTDSPWWIQQIARWHRVRHENQTLIGRICALAAGVGRIVYRKLRHYRHL
jgi:glycosyltransferase involved in cell wall biosynthesis